MRILTILVMIGIAIHHIKRLKGNAFPGHLEMCVANAKVIITYISQMIFADAFENSTSMILLPEDENSIRLATSAN